ncbi:holo-ACP synthase [Bacillus thuringiensis]|uniref:holo-ACP synthase n=1 Tax=Bacillus thuringiensis TaxID=1428 RepID=UPI001EDEBAC6|nr:4'-phosphopantetheinyl transferase superfamily protein [Bacillus thuringiensis]MCG3425938.1 4'-phosphopantetheinyl transferase superfamily protein [Bacillus thuringiensis]
MIRVGIDLVDIERFKLAVSRSGEPFISRILTTDEIEQYDSHQWAILFSAKESVAKIIKQLPKGFCFKDIQVDILPNNELLVTLRDPLYERVDLPTNSIMGSYKEFKDCIVTHLIL